MRTRVHLLALRRLRSIHLISAIVLLWGLSDAIVSFYVPIQVENFVRNLALFGLLLSLSSLAGTLSDPILGYISNRIRYTVLLFVGLLFSISVLITASGPLSIISIVWLMIAWGLYYEFIEIAIFSYVSRHHHPDEQSRYFGIIYLFLNIPYVAGPVIGGYLVSHGTQALYGLCGIVILLAMLFLPRLALLHRRREQALLKYQTTAHTYSFRRQLHSFRKVWKYASIFFVASMIFNIWEAFIWTLVPIQSIGGNAVFAGLITGIFTLPLAVLSGYGGEVADRFGRNATFVVGFFVAALFTLIFGMQTTIVWQITAAGVSSLGFAFACPAFMGETAKEGQDHETELGNTAAVQRIFVNAGFIFGPILGGIFGKLFGIQQAFVVLGGIMLFCFVPLTGALIHFHLKGRVHKSLTAEFDL